MSSWHRALRGVGAAAVLVVAGSATAQPAERYTLPGDRVAIYNLAGEIRVRGGGGAAVEVEIRRGGSDAARLTVAQGPLDDFQTLRVVYPADRVVYKAAGRGMSAQLRVREDGTFYHQGDQERGRRVSVTSEGRGLEAHADVSVRVPGGRSVALYLAVGEVHVSNVEGDVLVDVGSADVTTTGTKGGLIVDTGSGSVRVTDAEGEVKVDTGSGDVELSGIRGEQLIADTGSGSVRGTNLSASQVLVDTGSGSVDLSELTTTDVRVDTGSGAVRLALRSDVNWLEVDTGSGGVTLTIPDALGAEVEIETGSGGIEFDVPIEVHRVERSSLSGRIGDGQGRMVIGTGSGSVRLRRG